ncbi:MAG: ABC transporter permease [Acidobacteria bacterium]|nr:MAG: ABC transporter permease [Acidobacteriota bacterium]
MGTLGERGDAAASRRPLRRVARRGRLARGSRARDAGGARPRRARRVAKRRRCARTIHASGVCRCGGLRRRRRRWRSSVCGPRAGKEPSLRDDRRGDAGARHRRDRRHLQRRQRDRAASASLSRDRSRVFDAIGAYDPAAFNLTGQGEAERLNGVVVTGSLFPLVGARTAIGRVLQDADNQPGRARVAVLSHAVWQRRFGGDPGVVGRLVALEGQLTEIVGVLRPGTVFAFGENEPDVWMPIVIDAELLSDNNRGSRTYTVLARLKPGVTIAQAQEAMNHVADSLVRDYPSHYRGGFTTTVRNLKGDILSDTTAGLYLLLGAVSLVLAIACANIAGLLLVRAHARRKEIAIRAALGARRSRIGRQLLTESLVVSTIGGGVGLALAFWAVKALVALAPADIPRLHEVALDGRVVAFTAALSMLTGIVFGVAPALQASRADLTEALKEGSRTIAGGHRVRRALVVAEVALSLVVLIGAGLLINSFARLQDVAPGFDPSHLLTFRLAPSTAKYTFEKSEQLYADVFSQLASKPGVEAVAAIDALPFSGYGGDRSFFLEAKLNPPPSEKPDEQVRFVSAGYFSAMRIPLRVGREVTPRDTLRSPRVAVVNEALANKYWPHEDPIGKRVAFDRQEPAWYEVVGVAGNIRHRTLDAAEKPELYVPYSQPLFQGWTARPMFIVVRTSFQPTSAAGAVREVVASIDPDQPISSVRTMEDRIGESLGRRRFNTLLLSLFAALAVTLAAIGIYGIVAFAVAERTHEIGVRLALGARPRHVLAMIVADGMALVLAGTALGLAGAAAATRVMASQVFGISATDAATFAVVTIALALVGCCACLVPARRAIMLDPVTTLRAE